MFRKFYEKLKVWETAQMKEPVLVVGARQVGKTWLIREFCSRTYPKYQYFNFESMPELISVFDGSLEPETIIENLEILTGNKIDEDTAFFFDEIQRCEKAITSLKYFCESEKNYRVIGAGSLLGVKLKRFETSFSVGKVRIEKMYPMDFEEFLTALGEELLIKKIRTCADKLEAMPEALHQKALEYYQEYLFVGGMPGCVADFAEKKSILEFDRGLQDSILLAYSADMNKYTFSAAESVKIGEIFESIPRQLAKENPKFKYKEIRPHANKRDFAVPLDWLVSSMMVYKVAKAGLIQPPLKTYVNQDMFKIYMSDTGLLAYASGMQYRDLLPSSDNLFKGALTENYVIQQVSAAGQETYYYKPDASMEIDLLLDNGAGIIPVEIKAGRHVRSTSLKNYDKKYAPEYMIRLSYRNFGSMDKIHAVPLYALFTVL